MKRRFSFYLLILLLMIGLVIAGCGQKPTETSAPDNTPSTDTTATTNNSSSKEKVTLTYAFFAPANSFPAVQMQKWADELAARTDGQVEVQLFPGGSLLNASNMYEGVRNGVADIGLSAISYEPGLYPLHAISDMPSRYPYASVASQVLYDLIQEYPPDAFSDMKIITAFTTEPAYVQTTERVKSMEDMRGKQLRISGALTPIVSALGASPVGMSQAEVAEALQTGVIDGNVTSREVLMDFKLAEMTSYVVDYPLTVTSFVAAMNMDVWNSLPANVQEVIDELSREMTVFTGEYLDAHVQESINWSKAEHGLEITSLFPEEETRWENVIRPLQDEYVEEQESKGLPAKEYQKRLYELIEKYSN